MTTNNLPPLPEFGANFRPRWPSDEGGYSADQMRSYAAAALAAAVAEPLTDEQIDDLSRKMVKGGKSVNWLCRAIERAHGIKEQV